MMQWSNSLPIDAVLERIATQLGQDGRAVLQAPPGAGKTTRVPLYLLGASWLQGLRIIMLEPRRIAARNAAQFMAESIGEPVGQTVGFRTRLDSQISSTTRIEVVTEGVLSRLIQADPALENYGVVIFDEFHERSLHGDLGLALCLDARQHLREDLKVLVMSATLDVLPLAKLLGDVLPICSEGRSYPVDIRYADRPQADFSIEAVGATVLQALRDEAGSVLVFLPGVREIKALQTWLSSRLDSTAHIAPLYADLDRAQQQAAIAPAKGEQRKVVLATTIAETSLTIDGIRIVVDAGWARVPQFEVRSGMSRLQTVRVTQDAADQRTGRAGRLEPGVSYRVWSRDQQKTLLPRREPEILQVDLVPFALELAQWGALDPVDLCWLDNPPTAAMQQARELLVLLGAIDASGVMTPHGVAMAQLATHPRLAHMIIRGCEQGLATTACLLAALLGEQDIFQGGAAFDPDLRLRLSALVQLKNNNNLPGINVWRAKQVLRSAERLQRRVKHRGDQISLEDLGQLVMYAYPERVAKMQPGMPGRFSMSGGQKAVLAVDNKLAHEKYLAVASLRPQAQATAIELAVPVTEREIESTFAHEIATQQIVRWDTRMQQVVAERQRCLAKLVIQRQPLADIPPDLHRHAVLDGIKRLGVACLNWTPALRQWQARVNLLRRFEPNAWPDVSDHALIEDAEVWLAFELLKVKRADDFQRLDLHASLSNLLDWPQQQQLERLAPSHFTVPSGSRIALDYCAENPILAVRLQELFGLSSTPAIMDGRLTLTLHLLSPARRPIQVTQDLPGFWAGSYLEVKKEMKGRYPKHAWPDDPAPSSPLRGTKPRK